MPVLNRFSNVGSRKLTGIHASLLATLDGYSPSGTMWENLFEFSASDIGISFSVYDYNDIPMHVGSVADQVREHFLD